MPGKCPYEHHLKIYRCSTGWFDSRSIFSVETPIILPIPQGHPGLRPGLHLHLRLDHSPPRLRLWRQRLQRHGAAQRRGAVEQGRGEARPAVTLGIWNLGDARQNLLRFKGFVMEFTGDELNFMEFWWELPSRQWKYWGVWKHAIWFIPPRGRMAITITVNGVKLNQLIPGAPEGPTLWWSTMVSS